MNLTVKGNANEPSQFGYITLPDGKEYNVIPSDQFK